MRVRSLAATAALILFLPTMAAAQDDQKSEAEPADSGPAVTTATTPPTVQESVVTQTAVNVSSGSVMLPIPDASGMTPGALDVVLPISVLGRVTDVDVAVRLDHTWVGDLKIEVVSPGGKTVAAVDRIGVPGSAFGLSQDDFGTDPDDCSGEPLVLDDDADDPVEGVTAAPVVGSYKPNEPLSGLNNELIHGDWTVHITDNAGADTGTVYCVQLWFEFQSSDFNSQIYVSNRIAPGPAVYNFSFGDPNGAMITGDWDGDGMTGFGNRTGRFYSLVDERGLGEQTFAYGLVDDETFVGDWDANGTDTLAVRRGNVFYLANRIGPGVADVVLGYGKAGDEVFVGDWNGNGQATFAVRRGNVLFVRNSTTTGIADIVFGYGQAGDEMYVGDWDGDGIDTFAVRRGKEIFINNTFNPGPAEQVISFGKETDELLVGDFDGDGVDTFAVRRVTGPGI